MKKKFELPRRGLIISCQAAEGEPLYGLHLMRYMAKAAAAGGAVAIRALAEEIPEIKAETGLPVIGLVKRKYADSAIYITPTRKEIDVVLASGADVIAMDATARPRPNGETLKELVAYARKNSGAYLMADIDTLENAIEAERLGFDFVGTTLRSYTEETKGVSVPDYDFLRKLSAALKRSRLIAEGGIWETGQLEQVMRCGPYAVVIGTAVTRPKDITERFMRAMTDHDVERT